MTEQKTETRNVCLPFFPGFYNSLLSSEIDSTEERDAEHYAELESSEKYYPETYQPEHLQITAGEYQSIFFDCTDYQATYVKVSEAWADAFDWWMHEHLGTPRKSFVWEAMTSPREYNFSTDRVFADVPLPVIRDLFERSAAAGHEQLRACIKQSFTSYDGFCSFYSNDLEDWLEKPLDEWDHNELMTLVQAAIRSSDKWDKYCDRGEFNMSLYYSIFDSGGDDFRVVDWPKFERMVAELRAEKAEEAAE